MHSFVPALDTEADDARRAQRQEHAAAIKRWTRAYLRLDEATPITVTELACADPGCPLLETVIAVFEQDRTRRWKFTRPNVTVTKAMVQQTLATPPQ